MPLDNTQTGIVGLILLVGGAAFMETKGILEGIGSIMVIAGLVMLISAWRNRSK
jgi:uncharacterized membrane protein